MKVNPKVNNADVNKVLQDKTIQGLNTAQTSEVGKNSKAEKNKEVTSQEQRDASAKVDLSPRAQEMKKIKQLATSSPDVDEAKVKKFQELIDKGLYKVDSKKVADKMIEDSLTSSFQEEP
ncbi:MAG: flagellar biosynthesis anti-sigma factor FlgM [Bdellovibrionota bacterium]